jgi:multidrug efflux system membrane fusion protein
MSNQTTQTTNLQPSPLPPRPRRSKIRVWFLAVGFILLGLAAVWFYVIKPHLGQEPAGVSGRRAFMSAVMPVGAAVAQKGDLQLTLEGLGTVTPLATVTVKTQISGQLTQIAFQEGQRVKAGDFLGQIDPRIYQAQLEQYQGQLVRDQALLADAKLDLARYQKLNSQDSIARQQVDTQAAVVQQDEGNVQVDQAQIDTAKVNLAYCHIVSPVDGVVGIRQVDVGNYVQPSDTNGIVIITQMQPMSVIFTLPEDDISQVIKRMQDGATLTVTAYDRTDTTQIATGALATTDNQVDTTTGTVKLRAMFANEEEELFPQQFVNARLLVDTLHDAVLVPVAAVQHGSPGAYVYVVSPDNTVSVRKIKAGPSDGQNVSVTSGISPGEKVVTDGVDRLREGAKVSIPAENPNQNPPAGGPSGGHHRQRPGATQPDRNQQGTSSSPGGNNLKYSAATRRQRHFGGR